MGQLVLILMRSGAKVQMHTWAGFYLASYGYPHTLQKSVLKLPFPFDYKDKENACNHA